MYSSRTLRSLFVFILVSFLSTSVSAQDNNDTTSKVADDRSAPYNGFGLNFGVTIFVPKQVNDMIDDIYDDFKSGYTVISEFGAPVMFLGESFKLKGVFYLNRNIGLEPYGQAFWAGKLIHFTTSSTNIFSSGKSAWVHLLYYSGGLNTWIRLNPDKLVSFKTGAGAFGGYSHIEVTGDAGKVSLKGNGFGANVLAGIDITFKKAVVNLDFTVPIGVLKYNKRDGKLFYDAPLVYGEFVGNTANTGYKGYPKRVILTGFEFRPGVTFRF
jgi:hypothetical protein